MRSIDRAGAPARVPLSIRVSPETRDRLVAAAQESGRSLTTEIENRLSRTFERQSLVVEVMNLLFGEGLPGLLMIAGRAMRQAGASRLRQRRGDFEVRDWLADADAYDAAVTAVHKVLDEFRPEEGRPVEPDPHATGNRFALARIADVVNQGAPYPRGEREWIDQARALLGSDLMKESGWFRAMAKEDAAILAARGAGRDEQTADDGASR
ncbi:MAG TPA: TraY domain-containing protein [Stellaceae bacterium]|jgi:hypothetical protein